MSVQSRVLELRHQESLNARLAVQAIQNGRDPSWFIEQAGTLRAERYECEGTANILRPLLDERIDNLMSRTRSTLAQSP